TLSMSTAAISAYRQALRATRLAFQNDIPVLSAARTQIRQGFDNHRSLQEQEQIDEEIKKMNEISTFLVKNIVQGEKRVEGNKDRYYLKFHDKTELGDNETIKQAGRANMGSLAGVKAKKCS
ncbi:mitochondrial zinc maintenance protein 1, mitochondrial, partial [Suhomyces tanzawaensis NRRL Y-17324]